MSGNVYYWGKSSWENSNICDCLIGFWYSVEADCGGVKVENRILGVGKKTDGKLVKKLFKFNDEKKVSRVELFYIIMELKMLQTFQKAQKLSKWKEKSS